MIIISPYAKPLINGNTNAKNYPFWKELLSIISEDIIQVGVEGEEQLVDDFRKGLSISELKELIPQCDTWIAVDSFFQHLAWSIGKPGIVLWGLSDPNIFGHEENLNLLKDRKYLRPNQFLWWEDVPVNKDAWISPSGVFKYLR